MCARRHLKTPSKRTGVCVFLLALSSLSLLASCVLQEPVDGEEAPSFGKGCRVTRVLRVSILGRRLLKTSLSRKRTSSCALIALVVSSFPVGQVPRLFRHTT